MAKSRKGKVIQLLSPENYIRKKARTLPIFECLVDPKWEETGMATVVVARKHTNGNITFCTFMVDLLCLGVKDSFYHFNVSMAQYNDFKETIAAKMGMINIDYALAHNIVLEGADFAAEFGFKPHKNYESITQFMLEEDTDEIELIEIECGKDGNPFYMQGPYDDDTKANKIIAQLEKMAGPGNYDFSTGAMGNFNDVFHAEDCIEDDEDELGKM